MDVVNTKVAYNFLILLFLKFHDFRPAGLGAMLFTSSLSGFTCFLCRSETLCCLTEIGMESSPVMIKEL